MPLSQRGHGVLNVLESSCPERCQIVSPLVVRYCIPSIRLTYHNVSSSLTILVIVVLIVFTNYVASDTDRIHGMGGGSDGGGADAHAPQAVSRDLQAPRGVGTHLGR